MKYIYLFDDWFLFAKDDAGNRYYANTELWPIWNIDGYEKHDARAKQAVLEWACSHIQSLAWHKCDNNY